MANLLIMHKPVSLSPAQWATKVFAINGGPEPGTRSMAMEHHQKNHIAATPALDTLHSG
jgi:hypothetical protein